MRMKIALLADDGQWQEIEPVMKNVECIRFSIEEDFFKCYDAIVYMNLLDDAVEKKYDSISKPVIINSVVKTLSELNFSDNVIRINAWPGFLTRADWEVAGKVNEAIKDFFIKIKKTYTVVPDEPGMIAARIIAMIINEAYYALEENISTKEQIDIAMKLGTSYPYGPFEWSDKIGLKNIYALLNRLSAHDKRYLPAPLLQQSL